MKKHEKSLAYFTIIFFLTSISLIFYCLVKIKIYDCVIIGGGLSGLSAAYELRNKYTIILEKENRIGGRVFTKIKNEITFDLGAIFGYDLKTVPFEFQNSTIIEETGPVGIFFKNKFFIGQTPVDCMRQICTNKIILNEILDFQNKKTTFLSNEAYEILNAFFKVIHPGEMKEYIAERQADAFEKYNTFHFEKGNQELIEAFKKKIHSEILLKSEVLSVLEENGIVETTYKCNGSINKILSRCAIVTPPAPITKKIVTKIQPTTSAFLAKVKYGSFIFAEIALKNAAFPDFSYIVTPESGSNAILKQKTKIPGIELFVVCYGDKQSNEMSNFSDKIIYDKSLEILKRIGSFDNACAVDSEIIRWGNGGTIISGEVYNNFSMNCYTASPRVFLAGDYLFVDRLNEVFPYGMGAAISSGRTAAALVHKHLKYLKLKQ